MHFLKNKSTRVLLQIISALVLLSLVISYIYYKNINSSVDPRIVGARTLYEKYNTYAQQNSFDSVFILMDSIESIYKSVDHYKNSYEIGVLYNNRAAAFLTIALYAENGENKNYFQDSLMSLAETAAIESINYYDNWLNIYRDKNIIELKQLLKSDFYIGLDGYTKGQNERFLKNRIKEIIEAQSETKRRQSVSYTNLGIVYRYKEDYESAAKSYKTALELWERNLVAENNLNVLLGRPLRKRNFIEKMFPSSRDKD
ncbi:MAG: tetratricopeptide repeat protein [Bacteroidales bacterium]|jgi:tetratricopeptide (TPR) repeat protein|nr:tetratricopeptide repeat protein [Bacteroidales bacterium]